jgi:hypothetical protein
LSTGFDINPDGTGTPYISGTFTVPDGGWLAAAVQYGIGTNPSNWTELALITEGKFKLSPVNVGTVYSIRVRMITSTGHSDYITGQITATGDSTPPLEPTITAKATDKTVTVQCGLDNPPYDMGGFQIYRKKSTEQVYTLIGSVAANRGYASITDYVDEYVTYNYQAKSYDRSGNLSTNFSNVASVTVTGIQANDVAATALAMPTGSILRLSAKNCTTASIAEVNGVKDVSGNGNHGQAYGGVTVLDGGEGFNFDGTDDRIMVLRNFGISNTRFCSLSLRFKMTSNPTASVIAWFGPSDEVRAIIGFFTANNIFYINVNKNERAINNFYPLLNKEYHIVVVADDSKARLYIDGEMIQESEIVYTEYVAGRLAIGARINNTTADSFSYQFCGNISDVRIYPRALSASEIKTLFMFPDDVTFGQLTADLIGANVIKAQNLIKTEALITTTAQIDQAVVNNLNVVGNATFQSTLSTAIDNIDVGTRNLAKSTSETEIVMHSDSSSTGQKNYNLSITLEGNKKYTLSFYAKCSNTTDVFYCSLGLSGATKQLFVSQKKITTSYQKYSFTITKNSVSVNQLIISNYKNNTAGGSQSSNTGILYIKNVKLEEGNKSTTWTPAPEDVDSDINTVQSNLDAVTTNIYSPNTTTINGGKITTGTIQAAAIAANAITAEKLNVAALRKPQGALIELSAKGCTTASITASSGVKDISGMENHAKADSGVTIVQDLEKGTCFGFGTSTGITSNKKIELNSTNGVTFVFSLNSSAFNVTSAYPQVMRLYGSESGGFILQMTSKTIQIIHYNGTTTAWTQNQNGNYALNTWHHVAVSVGSSGVSIYLNGTRLTRNTSKVFTYAVSQYLTINKSNGKAGKMCDIAIYGRVLSDAEIKTLYMFSADEETGQITALRIATDAIRSRNVSGGSDGGYTTAGSRLDLATGWLSFPKCSISSAGVIKATDVDLTGKITATSGKIGDLNIDSSGIYRDKTVQATSEYSAIRVQNTWSTSSVKVELGIFHDVNGSNYNPMLRADWTYKSSNVNYRNRMYVDPMLGFYCEQRRLDNNSHHFTRIGPDSSNFNGFGSTSDTALSATGKVYVNGSVVHGSDENIKSEIKDVSTLEKLKKIRVKSWKYDEEKIAQKEYKKELTKFRNGEIDKEPVLKRTKSANDNPVHIGAMAAEFNNVFGTNNNSEDYISYTDEIGVCMRAIQELAAEVDELKAKLKIQQDEKSEIIEHFNDLVKDSDSEDELIEPSFDELLKDGENQQEEQK